MTTNDLSPKKAKFIEALFVSPSVRAAAQRAGIGEKTARRYLADPAVQEQVRRRTAEMLDEVSRRLLTLAGEATTTLQAALVEAPWPVRLRAAETVLTQLARLAELADLQRRIEALEERVGR